jgi:hypothetical protein
MEERGACSNRHQGEVVGRLFFDSCLLHWVEVADQSFEFDDDPFIETPGVAVCCETGLLAPLFVALSELFGVLRSCLVLS